MTNVKKLVRLLELKTGFKAASSAIWAKNAIGGIISGAIRISQISTTQFDDAPKPIKFLNSK